MLAKIVVPGVDVEIVKIETVNVEVGVIVIVMETVETKIVVEVIGIVVVAIAIGVTKTEMIRTVVEEGIEIGEADEMIAAAGMIEIADGVMTAIVVVPVVRTNNTVCRFKSSNYGKIHSLATG